MPTFPVKAYSLTANDGNDITELVVKWEKFCGSGSFGKVYLASVIKCGDSGSGGRNNSTTIEQHKVAIKSVLQDSRYRNRELPMMRSMQHPNIVKLYYYYYTVDDLANNSQTTDEDVVDDLDDVMMEKKKNNRNHHNHHNPVSRSTQKLLHLMMEYIPCEIFDLIKHFNKLRRYRPTPIAEQSSSSSVPPPQPSLPILSAIFATPQQYSLTIKLVMYQLFRALSYIHSSGVCHRDIKPNNLLFNPYTGVLKVCDFGNSKRLNPFEKNISYICARAYRAPELLFGATNYTNQIDLWSAGIVFAELLTGDVLFMADSSIDLLVRIIGKLGTPSKEEIFAMNRYYCKYAFPQVSPKSWDELLPSENNCLITHECRHLIAQLFRYNPNHRIHPLVACAHEYFDELRDGSRRWLHGQPLPPLFDFTTDELKPVCKLYPHIRYTLIPQWMRSGGGAGPPSSLSSTLSSTTTSASSSA